MNKISYLCKFINLIVQMKAKRGLGPIKTLCCGMMLCVNTLFAQSVGLVLSGGGAKGVSHVGVIKALEENNIK